MNENEISKIIVDRAIKVHRVLGAGLFESVYQGALAYELQKAGLSIETEKDIPVNYEGIQFDRGFRADIVVENKVLVELKSVDGFHPVHEAQVLTYLKFAEKKLGLLINFNVPRLKDGLKRYVL